jgi:transcriptional regulator with XRE-family HTH domain
MNTWATRIKSRMKELGLTQEVLAEKMGITRGAITHYLAGRREPPLRQFQKLATIRLGFSSAKLQQNQKRFIRRHLKKRKWLNIRCLSFLGNKQWNLLILKK